MSGLLRSKMIRSFLVSLEMNKTATTKQRRYILLPFYRLDQARSHSKGEGPLLFTPTYFQSRIWTLNLQSLCLLCHCEEIHENTDLLMCCTPLCKVQ